MKSIPIIGYGEDALTYWALTSQLDSVLEQLNKRANEGVKVEVADISAILYRPSLGRGKGCYGEFDAIVVARKKKLVFLIESKWHRSKEIKKSRFQIVIERRQITRHDKLSGYIKGGVLNKILQRHIDNGDPLPKRISLRDRNLCEILKRTGQGTNDIVNVLMLFSREIITGDWKVMNTNGREVGFRTILIKCDDSDFFTMNERAR